MNWTVTWLAYKPSHVQYTKLITKLYLYCSRLFKWHLIDILQVFFYIFVFNVLIGIHPVDFVSFLFISNILSSLKNSWEWYVLYKKSFKLFNMWKGTSSFLCVWAFCYWLFHRPSSNNFVWLVIYFNKIKNLKRHSWTNIKGDQMLKKLLKKNIQYI